MEEQVDFHQILTWFLSRKSLYLENEGPWVISMMAKNIGHTYRALPKYNGKLKDATVQIKAVSEEDYRSKDVDYLDSVLKLKEFVSSYIEEHVVDFLIHGSISTLDYSKGWSDLDTLVIVSSETIENPRALMTLREKLINAHDYLLQLDSLQHHGFIYCTEFDLSQYLTHCMPIAVLEESKSLIKDSELLLKYDRSNIHMRRFFDQKVALFKKTFEEGVLRHHQYDGKYLQENYKDLNTMYQMKYFLSIVMSLPIYYLDALGEPSYKRDSFGKIKSLFGKEWDIVEKASLVREKWGELEEYPYVGNDIPSWLCEELGGDYFERAYLLSKVMSEKLAATEICGSVIGEN